MNKSRFFINTLLTAPLLLLSGQVSAILIYSSAFLDLTSIQVIPAAGVSLEFTPSFNVAETQVNSSVDVQFDPDAAYSDLSSASGFVQATAWADASLVAALTSTVDEAGYASALAWHELAYQASGSGQVEVKVNYQIDQGIFDLSPAWEGFLYALVELLDEASARLVYDEAFYDVTAGNGSFARSGVLSLLLDVQDGQTGYLVFTALSEAHARSVPAPATWFLLLPFLGALFMRKEVSYDHG